MQTYNMNKSTGDENRQIVDIQMSSPHSDLTWEDT